MYLIYTRMLPGLCRSKLNLDFLRAFIAGEGKSVILELCCHYMRCSAIRSYPCLFERHVGISCQVCSKHTIRVLNICDPDFSVVISPELEVFLSKFVKRFSIYSVNFSDRLNCNPITPTNVHHFITASINKHVHIHYSHRTDDSVICVHSSDSLFEWPTTLQTSLAQVLLIMAR